ncbi:MAG: FAD:protein FMN transferase [Bacteroidales bacterium]|nr:FAD:protein FMN transferase [Bacteroidales bacterium]MCF8396678.1 FAD:protein FMN transferase [Bacteroidales bacterium]
MWRLLYFIIIFLLLSCCESHQKVSFTGEAQGTYYALTYFDKQGRNLQNEIDSLLKDFDQVASMWVENSILSRVNRGDTTVDLNEPFMVIFKKSVEVAEKTHGAFDFTVGPLINAWGFGFQNKMKMDQHIVDSILNFVGYEKVKIANGKVIKSDPRIQFDFNAIAQGYSVDLLADFLRSKDIDRFLVDIGGEVYAEGNKPGGEQWKVGIEKPAEDMNAPRELQAVIFLRDKALATSGSYRKFYVEDGIKYSHTLDPKTGYPVQHSLLSATVLASDCMTADAYATAFMVMGLEKTKNYLNEHEANLEVYLIYSDEEGKNQTYMTSGMRSLMYR